MALNSNNSVFRPKTLDLLGHYSWQRFRQDALAGIIVGIVAIPLALAFGIASGVSPEVGIMTAIVGGFLVSLLGGSAVQIGGPTGAFIVIVYGIIQEYGLDGLLLACFLAGILLVLMGVLRLGTLIKFIPYPIIVGFTAGIALTIFSTQINDLLGLGLEKQPANFIAKWQLLISTIGNVSLSSLLIGLGTIVTIILMPKLSKVIPGSLVAILLTTMAAYLLRGQVSIDTIGDHYQISNSIPSPALPSFSWEKLQGLLSPAFTIAMLGAIESLLSASVADGIISDRHRSNTELIGQGVANMVVPFFGGIPVTGAIARTMTNINNGGRSPIAGIIHSLTLLIIFLFLMPLASEIPMACLAGILVMVSYNMSGWRSIIALAKGPKLDFLVMLATFILTVVFDLTIAIELGLLLAMLIFMRRMVESTQILVSTGELKELSLDQNHHAEAESLHLPKGVAVFEIDGPYFFGIANKMEEEVISQGMKEEICILRMRKVPFMDSTGVENLRILIKNAGSVGVRLILSGVRPEVHKLLCDTGIEKLIGEEYICTDIHQALDRARNLIKNI